MRILITLILEVPGDPPEGAGSEALKSLEGDAKDVALTAIDATRAYAQRVYGATLSLKSIQQES